MAYVCGSRYIAFQVGDNLLTAGPDPCERIACPRCGPARVEWFQAHLREKAISMTINERVRPVLKGIGTNALGHIGLSPELWIGDQHCSNNALRQRAGRKRADYLALSVEPGLRKLVGSRDLGGLCLVGIGTVMKFVGDWAFGHRADWTPRWKPVKPPGSAQYVGSGSREAVGAAFRKVAGMGLGLAVGNELWLPDDMSRQLGAGMVAEELRRGDV